MKRNKLILLLIITISLVGCGVKKEVTDTTPTYQSNQSITSSMLPIDTVRTNSKDSIANIELGRKVIHRDVSAVKWARYFSGIIAVRFCVNREGIVTHNEIITEETTVKDVEILNKYLESTKKYKVKPDQNAPELQCGKLTFKSSK